MNSTDGETFIKELANFVRTHEKALANALQFRRQSVARHKSSQSVSSIPIIPASSAVTDRPSTSASNASSGIASALSIGPLNFTSQPIKPQKLSLTPHHLFYLLSRIEELEVAVGPMKVRLENLQDASSAANYVSFLSQTQRSKSRSSDVVSIRSVSSIRSVVSGMSSLWSSFGFGGSSAARIERQKAAIEADLKYLYSAFTKIPCLRLSPDWKLPLVRGYEEFPFDSAVPLHVFKNVQSLEIRDIDYRQFFGWDRLADNLRSLTLRHASVNQPSDILIDIVLDDMDGRRRRTTKKEHTHSSPTTPWPAASTPRRGSPTIPNMDSAPGSPDARTSMYEFPDTVMPSQLARRPSVPHAVEARSPPKSSRPRSHSPSRPATSRHASTHARAGLKIKRSGSGSSHSSLSESWPNPRGSCSNLLSLGIIPASKWRFLRHLSLAENDMIELSSYGLSPLANTLHALDLSANQFNAIPDSLATLSALRHLNLAQNVISDLRTLKHSPLPAITAMNLRANRLQDIAGIETLPALERLDLRENQIKDPQELARLTSIPELREIYVEGNPFTRTHRDYRVTIFNLFRSTPGFTEDIIIDGTGPSYSEKKRLVDRAPIPPAVPVIRPPASSIPAIDVSKPAIIYDTPPEPAVLRKERPVPKATTSEVHTSSTRRKRAPKRRIVDLSTTSLPPGQTIGETTAPAVERLDSSENYRVSLPPESQQRPSKVTTEANVTIQHTDIPRLSNPPPQLPPIFPEHIKESQWPDAQQWDVEADLYRQKIEALRDRVGSGYLSILGEENFSQSSLLSNTAPRMATAQPIHSGRTLG